MGAAGRKRPVRGGRRCIPGLHTAPPAPSRQGMTVCSGGEERGGDPCVACGSRGGRRGGASSTTSSSSTATSAGYAHEWQAPRACRLLLSTSSHVVIGLLQGATPLNPVADWPSYSAPPAQPDAVVFR
ncbi:hypothetical protein GQ55_5G405300 [Panicum hallii var. hallii]|uniref:Uncharacterized protein n=1 Tax=Panicum hallii var. hallii TaxID=1504633 RepID=A0A2T7DNI9_9POAL|nr:hypothetical protein GQ55_5G405300 [Panicum hallii var. hallii]PUZ57149.1 hypothetical protein GQ55_5G405300 [Panicum hallii var. hallii]PUZ57150.1 hypothetical protein GQ55_5G405300 [Panicum hallii var. hallii]PUZ57151.1 hypothetical protein GQ55_5G405300 [Panicum hallii var. hallii]